MSKTKVNEPNYRVEVQMRITACAFMVAVCFAAPGLTNAPLETAVDKDIYEMVATIAGPTAGAKIGGGNQSFEKVVTLNRNAEGVPVVTSMQVVAAEKLPEIPDGTRAVMIVHYAGQCSAPYGNDGAGLSEGVFVFVVSSSGKNIWQVHSIGNKRSMRLLKTATDSGPWEEVKPSPDQYLTYRCDKYR